MSNSQHLIETYLPDLQGAFNHFQKKSPRLSRVQTLDLAWKHLVGFYPRLTKKDYFFLIKRVI